MSGVGIVSALPAEVRTLVHRPARMGTVMRLDDEVEVALSGVGPERAIHSGRSLLERGAAALLSWGTAAALHPALKPGTIVLPSEVIDTDGVRIPVHADWLERVRACISKHLPTVVGPLAATRGVLVGLAEKRALARSSDAIAADMESAALGRLALKSGVPFLAVRAIADTDDMTVPSWLVECLDESGRLRPITFVSTLMRHPEDIRDLTPIAFAYKAATVALERVQARAGAELRFSVVLKPA